MPECCACEIPEGVQSAKGTTDTQLKNHRRIYESSSANFLDWVESSTVLIFICITASREGLDVRLTLALLLRRWSAGLQALLTRRWA